MKAFPKKRLVILGAAGFAEEALDLVMDTKLFEVVCFVEGIDRDRCGKQISGIPVRWSIPRRKERPGRLRQSGRTNSP
jgi:hypothetical protein